MPLASPSRSSVLCRRRFGQLAAGAVAACVGGAGAGRAQGSTAIRFALDRRFDALAAPFLAAQDKGYFGTEGLDVVIEPGNGARAMLQRLASGAQDAGFGDINALVRFRDENPGSDLKAVMIVHDRPGYAVIGRKSRASPPRRRASKAASSARPASMPASRNGRSSRPSTRSTTARSGSRPSAFRCASRCWLRARSMRSSPSGLRPPSP